MKKERFNLKRSVYYVLYSMYYVTNRTTVQSENRLGKKNKIFDLNLTKKNFRVRKVP